MNNTMRGRDFARKWGGGRGMRFGMVGGGGGGGVDVRYTLICLF
jgi:hypothetical protein